MLLVSFLSLGLRTGMVVALSVPLVLAIVFFVMSLMGMDLNRITLGALIIALGLLVDDAIIAIEMMVVKTEAGWDRTRAAGAAWDITAFPMLTGTLVTAAGFIPVGFAASAVAEYAGGIFWVVAIALIVSWFVAVIFTPYLGVMLLPRQAAAAHDPYGSRDLPRLRAAIDACLRHRLQGGRRRRRRSSSRRSSASATCSSSSSRSPSGRSCSCRSSCRRGRRSPRRRRRWRRRRRCSKGDADVEHATAYVGQGSVRFWLGLNPQLPNPSFAEIVILSKDTEARERIKARLEQAVAGGALSEARVRVDRFNFGPPVGHPVQFRVIGKDPQEVRRIAGEVRDAMAQNPDVRDPHLQWNEMAPAIRLVVDQDRARALGLAPQDIAETLQTLVSGLPVTEMRDGTDLVQVVARAVPGERLDVAGPRRPDGREPRRRGGAAGAGGADRAGGRGADPLAAEPRAGDLGARRHPRRGAGAGRDERDPAGAGADQGGAAGGLPDRDRRARSRRARRATARSSRCSRSCWW